VNRLVVSALRDKPVANFETTIRHADGRSIRVALSTAAVRNPAGEVEGVIAVGQDLTQLKNLEKAVIQAEKLASLGQLAAGVAHEINNPLTTISIYADALVRKLKGVLAFSEPSRPVAYGDAGDLDKLTRILEASDRILKLARDLTSYARPAPEVAEPIDLHPVLDQAIAFCDHVIKESEVQLTRRYAPGLPRVPALRSNLVQVFVNLLTNACHATPPGGLVVVATGPGPLGGVEVRVTDTGSGIAPEHLSQIFEPFFTTKAEGRGTGLGLSIVQGIVAKHGGTIEVQSQPGQGTTFTVKLPGA
jgi:signal transduction histidine kinase